MSAHTSPKAQFPQFYDNPAVKALAPIERWTISGQLTEDSKGKAPIDLRELLDRGRLRGAWALDSQCLVSLEELTTKIPNAANAAFYLKAQIDGLMVIDIEKHCPPEISAALLRLPEIVYSELSMSGLGYHLVAPLPKNFRRFPIAAEKTVLQGPNKYYEILLDHWVTFTRRPIETPPTDKKGSAAALVDQQIPATTAELYALLAKDAVETASAMSIQVDVEPPEIAFGTHIVARIVREPFTKSLADFNNDHSRWEFSVLGVLYARLRPLLTRFGKAGGHTYTDSDQAWLLYLAAVKVLEPRAKHAERRNGRPFLLERAASLIAERRDKNARLREDADSQTHIERGRT